LESVIEIVTVELDGKDGIWVTLSDFSDGTPPGYIVKELLDIRPPSAVHRGDLKLIGGRSAMMFT